MSETPSSQSLRIGDTVLWYEILSVLGQGGFGITYRALDTNLDVPVAIKEYLPTMFATRGPDGVIAPDGTEQKADYEWGLARFIDEGRTLARFDHPGIVRVSSVFEQNGTAYLVMRYEQGRALDSVLKQAGTLPETQIKRILFDVMDGLVHVHDAGFIHRDIKPANIYLRQDGSAVLIDFGSARQALGVQTQTLTTLVSPGYAPFEQYSTESAQQGPWTDIYALGATAYRAMTGRSPTTAVDRSRALLTSAPDQTLLALDSLNEYSDTFVHAIERAMAFHETDRPQSVAEWRALFEPGGAPAATIARPVQQVGNTDSGEDTVLREDAPTEVLPNPAPEAPRARYRLALGVAILAAVAAFGWWRPWHGDTAAPDSTGRHVAADVEPVIAPSTGQTVSANAAVPDRAEPVDPIASAIAQKLAEADEHFAANRLTRPPGGNALDAYRDVLARDPFNDEAEAGIERIVQDRLSRSRDAARSGDLAGARAYLDEAALADPAHRDVLVAQSELPVPHATPAAAPARAEPVTTVSRPAPGGTVTPELTDTLIGQAERLADPRTRQQLRNARKAVQKQDYRKAIRIFRKELDR